MIGESNLADCRSKMVQSALVAGMLLITSQATITLELKPRLPMTTGGTQKSLRVVDNAFKNGAEVEVKINLPQCYRLVLAAGVLVLNMIQYVLVELARGRSKMVQSALVAGMLLITSQATITLELNHHWDAA